MTRGDIHRQVALLLGESFGSPGFGEPLWLAECVVDATDQVARASDAFQTWFENDITGTTNAPMERVCAPAIYKIKRVRIKKQNGKFELFRMGDEIVAPDWMDDNHPDWQDNPPVGDPRFLILSRPDLILYPRPAYTIAAGIRIYGFGVPGRTWNSANPEPEVADEFPLPEYAASAVVHTAAMLRCIQFPSADNLKRLPMIERRAEDLTNRLCRDVALEYSRAKGIDGETY